ncbi:fibrillin-2-like [Ruditapes philippinarum]|uniref:fibrillin-2-like n=1 Tax=Ruditapes philippinarum TaxID=129788 RepID=UPI00295C2EE4|nr:fibrillin-2-like [Ruditapes philippinarum]
MMTRKIFLLAAVLSLQTCSFFAAKVSDTDCTDGDGVDQCSGFENAKCDDTDESMKCKCSSGYKEVVVNTDSICEKDTLSSVDCTKDTDGQCTHTENAECNEAESNAKCRCANGYKIDPTDDTSCIKNTLSNVDCTKDTDGQCTHTENAECNEAESNAKCRCVNGYKMDPTDDTSCIKDTLSSVDCTKETADQCTHTENAECDGAESNAKCRCVNGYREDPDDDTSCIKTLESSCSGINDCPGVVNSICDGSKCICKTDHEEKENDCILTVSGKPCSAATGGCEDIGNSICDVDAGKCTCSPGFTMKIDECIGNNANAFKTGWVAFLLFFVLKLFY